MARREGGLALERACDMTITMVKRCCSYSLCAVACKGKKSRRHQGEKGGEPLGRTTSQKGGKGLNEPIHQKKARSRGTEEKDSMTAAIKSYLFGKRGRGIDQTVKELRNPSAT